MTFRQIVYQIWYQFKWRYITFNPQGIRIPEIQIHALDWKLDSCIFAKSYLGNKSFRFLNLTKTFENGVIWNFEEYGKLWNYHLQYMDCLLDEEINVTERKQLLLDITAKMLSADLKLEPYPVSLRLINTLVFIQKYSIQDLEILKSVYFQLAFLERNLEYHLLGNHLLENHIAICFAITSLEMNEKLEKSYKELFAELSVQILNDGAHYERTPGYHVQILNHLMQLLYLLQIKGQRTDYIVRIGETCSAMLGWYKAICLDDLKSPLLNDTVESNLVPFQKLDAISKQQGICIPDTKLKGSNYFLLKNEFLKVLINGGNISPSYQPGHAHADMMQIVLYYKKKAILIDPGISTYESGSQRLEEKSTRMHNTISFGTEDQSQLWSSFRIAERARLKIINNQANELIAEVHWTNGQIHRRRCMLSDEYLLIEDAVINLKDSKSIACANFHFDFLMRPYLNTESDKIQIDSLKFEFENANRLEIKNYDQCIDFNKRHEAIKISAYFTGELKTIIRWNQ